MWKKFKHSLLELKNDVPGERFVNAHKRWSVHARGYVATTVIVVVGLALILAGMFLGFVPGAPGIVLVVLGAALIGTRFHRVAVWLDWIEVRSRKLWQRCRRSFAR